MKMLIAISTCEAFEHNGSNQAQRDTWLRNVAKVEGLDYKFFVGHGPNGSDLQREGYPKNYGGIQSDTVQVDCLDDYGHLTYKTQASLRWAYENGYEFVFRCFPDTYVRVDRLMSSGFKSHCYHGDFRGEVTEAYALNYASGGAGYWLSKNAYQHLLDAPILGIWRDELMVYVEDMWVGNILGRARQAGNTITYFNDKRFINKGQSMWPHPNNNFVTAHLSAGPVKYYAKMMHMAHEVWRVESKMNYSKNGMALTESFESCRLTAYQDVKGVWTIGWGHTGPEVHEGLEWTQMQANLALLSDLGNSVATVNKVVTIGISQNEFDALVDFDFNAGGHAFATSTLLKDLNAGNFEAAAAQFDNWDHASGKVVAGLLRRRQAETAEFLGHPV